MKNNKIIFSKRIRTVITKRLNGQSLVEVLVAIAVCMIVFSLSVTILLKVEKEDNSLLRLKADVLQKKLHRELDTNIETSEDTIYLDRLVIYRKVQLISDMPGVFAVQYRAFSNSGTPLSVRNLLVSSKEHADE